MRALPQLALALALLAMAAGPAAALQEPMGIGFRVPAQAEGRISIAGAEWALLVFPPSQSAVLDVRLPNAGEATTESYVHSSARTPVTGKDRQDAPAGVSHVGFAPGQQVTATFPQGRWGFLFVEADAIGVWAGETLATVGRAAASSDADLSFPTGQVPYGTLPHVRPRVPEASASVSFAAASEGLDFWLEATGVRRVEWHNATVSCLPSGDCPDGPAYQSFEPPLPASQARVEMRNYTEMATQGGLASASGHAFLAAVGGSRIDLAVDGAVRLPAARLGACEPECDAPANGTLRAEGNLTLAGLEPEPGRGDRLHGRFGGTVAGATLDETSRLDLARSSAVAVGAAVGIALLAKALAVLLWRRQSRKPPQDHPRRQELQRLVVQEPGLTFRQLQRRVGWGNGVTRHHIECLLEAGAIMACRHRNTVRYFENHGRHEADWRQVVQLRDPDQRWLHGWLAQHGGAGQTAVIRAASQARGWSRSATQRRLKSLVAAGLVRIEARGRAHAYAAQAAPMGMPEHGAPMGTASGKAPVAA